jgi:hypothetical protein
VGVAPHITAADGRGKGNPFSARLYILYTCRGDKTAIEHFLASVRDWGVGLRRFFVRLPDDK